MLGSFKDLNLNRDEQQKNFAWYHVMIHERIIFSKHCQHKHSLCQPKNHINCQNESKCWMTGCLIGKRNYPIWFECYLWTKLWILMSHTSRFLRANDHVGHISIRGYYILRGEIITVDWMLVPWENIYLWSLSRTMTYKLSIWIVHSRTRFQNSYERLHWTTKF